MQLKLDLICSGACELAAHRESQALASPRFGLNSDRLAVQAFAAPRKQRSATSGSLWPPPWKWPRSGTFALRRR